MTPDPDPVEVVITVDTSAFYRYLTLVAERHIFDVAGDFERQVRAIGDVMNATSDAVDQLREKAFMLGPTTRDAGAAGDGDAGTGRPAARRRPPSPLR